MGSEKPRPSATLSTKNHTRPGLGSRLCAVASENNLGHSERGNTKKCFRKERAAGETLPKIFTILQEYLALVLTECRPKFLTAETLCRLTILFDWPRCGTASIYESFQGVRSSHHKFNNS
jgi:hypothetical protein